MDVCINFSDKKTRQSQECGIRLSLAQIQDARVSQFIDIYSSFIPPPQKKTPCTSLANRPHPMTSHNSNLVNQWRYILHQQTIFQLLLWAFLLPPKLERLHIKLWKVIHILEWHRSGFGFYMRGFNSQEGWTVLLPFVQSLLTRMYPLFSGAKFSFSYDHCNYVL